ncbi:MAG TPA: hypothetical protein VFZ82_01165 [Methylomirabilota bacterium]|jgi:hypothetical protein|nr:hypothetical protein [Methylomirabilota bacterium]
MHGLRRVLAGLGRALRARRGTFAGVAATVFALDILVPPLVLSIARTRVDYFTFNPWLPSLPGYLRSGPGSLGERLERAFNLALFWFSADGIFGVDWGFAVTASDLARFALMAVLVGAYFALWRYRRDRTGGGGRGLGVAPQGGVLGAAGSVLGLATGGCTVMGCGAPMIPVVGLAFVGLSSGTLAWLAQVSTIATVAVMAGMTLGGLYLAWRIGASDP